MVPKTRKSQLYKSTPESCSKHYWWFALPLIEFSKLGARWKQKNSQHLHFEAESKNQKMRMLVDKRQLSLWLKWTANPWALFWQHVCSVGVLAKKWQFFDNCCLLLCGHLMLTISQRILYHYQSWGQHAEVEKGRNTASFFPEEPRRPLPLQLQHTETLNVY